MLHAAKKTTKAQVLWVQIKTQTAMRVWTQIVKNMFPVMCVAKTENVCFCVENAENWDSLSTAIINPLK